MDGNPFADLIPQQNNVAQSGGQNPFADLVPRKNPYNDEGQSWSEQPQMSWGEAFKQGIQNIPQDAGSIAAGLAQLGTARGMGQYLWNSAKTGAGLAEKAVGLNPIGNEQQGANDLLDYFKGYTTPEGIKQKIAEHPVSTALDVATLVTPLKGLGLAAKGGELAAEVAPKIATVADLKAGGGAALNAARESGVYFTPDFVKPLKDTLVQAAYDGGFRPGRQGTADLSNIMKDVNAMSERPWTFRDIHELEQDLNDAYVKAKSPGDKRSNTIAAIAGRQRNIVRQFMDQVAQGNTEGIYSTGDMTPEQATKLHSEGLKIYRQAKVAQKLESMGMKASVDAPQFAQSGEANALRKYTRQVLRAHYDGKATGFNSQEINTLQQFNKGSFREWLLKQAARHISPLAGSFIGSSIGGGVGGTLGFAAGLGIKEGAKAAADRIAIQKFNRFVEAVRQDGGTRLENLLGQAVHEHLYGTDAGKSAIRKWRDSIGTKSFSAASRALAVTAAQSVKRPDLVPQIYSELQKLEGQLQNFANQWQGNVPSEAQPQQQQ